MANTDNANGFKWVKSLTGNPSPLIDKGYTMQSQTIARGDALITNSSGRIQLATDQSGVILGVANEAISNSATDSEITFIPALPWYVFEGQCSSTYARTMRYTSVDIEGGTGAMEINEDATTELVARVIGENPNTEIGNYSRVWFVFERSDYLNLQDVE